MTYFVADAAQYFSATEDQVKLLNDVLAQGDPAHITAALGTVIRAQNLLIAEMAGQRSRMQALELLEMF